MSPKPPNESLVIPTPPPRAVVLTPIRVPPANLSAAQVLDLVETQNDLATLVTFLWHSGHTGETWPATRHVLDQRLRHMLIKLGRVVDPLRVAR